jgi:hypothetical protein
MGYIYIPKAKRVQLARIGPRATVGRLIGYEDHKGHLFKMWIPDDGTIVRSRDVRFVCDEMELPAVQFDDTITQKEMEKVID